MLGVCLLFVGIVLLQNGVCSLAGVDRKSAAVMNIFTGLLSVTINVIHLVREIIMGQEQAFCLVLHIFL